jgi:LmbE family N-acetylglucosaminyl deacetylase
VKLSVAKGIQKEAYDAVYLSPHLDDAVLSCGGQICQRSWAGEKVLIVTVTAGDPPSTTLSRFADQLHDRWHLALEAVSARRIEDAAACDLLGADYVHWDLADCIYRQHPDTEEFLYASEEAIFGPIHPAEIDLVAVLSSRISALPTHQQLIVPLAVGHHVDHQLTRKAAERQMPVGLKYYEDYPYAQLPGAVKAVFEVGDAWKRIVIPLTDLALDKKVAAIAAYQSQLSTFFQSRADLKQRVLNYAQQVGGERLWRRV